MKTGKSLATSVRFALILLGGSGLVRPAIVQADELVFSNGTVLSGVRLDASSSENVATFEIEDGVKIGLAPSSVRIVQEDPNAALYLKNAGKIRDTVESHTGIIKWANDKGRRDIALAHTERLVELEPNNAAAWRLLKYEETSGGWIPQERYWLSKGMIREGARWKLPQDAAIAKAIEDRKKASYEIKRRVDASMRDLLANNNRTPAAQIFFAELRDPNALAPLLEQLKEHNSNQEMRSYLVDVIARLDTNAVSTALVSILVAETDAMIRNRCIDYLLARPREAAIQKLQSYLTNNDPLKDRPEVINRAAEALAEIGDERSIQRLIDVLVTKHRRPAGPSTTTNVGQVNGNAGFGSGGAKLVEVVSRNPDVYAALQRITGQSLSYNKDEWLNWYALTYADTGLNLRRDP